MDHSSFMTPATLRRPRWAVRVRSLAIAAALAFGAALVGAGPAAAVVGPSDPTAPVEPAPVAGPGGDLAESFEWVVDYPTGLHARPASTWVETARSFAAERRFVA